MMQACDQCHVTADTAQPRKQSNVSRPFPLRVGSGHETNMPIVHPRPITMTGANI